MSDILVGVAEAESRGFLSGLVVSQKLISHEGKYSESSVIQFTQKVVNLLQDMIDKINIKETKL